MIIYELYINLIMSSVKVVLRNDNSMEFLIKINNVSFNCFTNDVITVSREFDTFFGELNEQFVDFLCLTTKKRDQYLKSYNKILSYFGIKIIDVNNKYFNCQYDANHKINLLEPNYSSSEALKSNYIDFDCKQKTLFEILDMMNDHIKSFIEFKSL